MTRGRALLVALISGGLLSLSFPEPDITVLAWLSIAPLLYVARGAGWRRGATLGFVFGLGFFGALLIWIKYVGWFAWALLVLLQSAFAAIFGGGWGVVSRRSQGLAAVVGAASLWVAVEYLRQQLPVLGFTWGQLAQSQHDFGYILKWAKLGGGWTVAFVIVAVNAALTMAMGAMREQAVRPRSYRRTAVYAACIGLVFVLPIVPSLLGQEVRDTVGIDVAIVQGNVPRVFAGTIAEKDVVILNSHARLTRALADEDLDLIVWPESSVGVDLDTPTPKWFLQAEQHSAGEIVAQAAKMAGTEMIVGGNQRVGDDKYKVLAYHFGADGGLIDTYQKTHLVPFGEYVPWRGVLGWIPMLEQIPRDAVAGSEGKVFDTQAGRIAPVISFEGDFGSLVRERVGVGGGQLLVVATNTSTWETSWSSAQHVAFSQVRAVENGVWVAHAALSGISAFISEDGRVVQSSDLWTEDTLIQRDVSLSPVAPTFYNRTGDWLPIVCLIVALVEVAVGIRRRTGTVA